MEAQESDSGGKWKQKSDSPAEGIANFIGRGAKMIAVVMG